MVFRTNVGVVSKISEDLIEWSIEDFFSAITIRDKRVDIIQSPTFTVAKTFWCLSLFPTHAFPTANMKLLLQNKTSDTFSIEYLMGLKKFDGSVAYSVQGVKKTINEVRKTRKVNKILNVSCFIGALQDLLERQSDLVPGNVLTITCTIKCLATSSYKILQSVDTKPWKLIKLENLSASLKDILDDKETCDTTIKVKDREFKAHRIILMARSPVFAATFKHDTLERQTGIITIQDCDPESFQEFLEYLYCGKLERISYRSALALYLTSHKYDVQELREFCVEYLMQNLTVEGICEVAVLADKYDEIKLLSAVQDIFNKYYIEVLTTSEWNDLLTKHPCLAKQLLKEMSKLEKPKKKPKLSSYENQFS